MRPQGPTRRLEEAQSVEAEGNIEELDKKPRRKRSDQTESYK